MSVPTVADDSGTRVAVTTTGASCAGASWPRAPEMTAANAIRKIPPENRERG